MAWGKVAESQASEARAILVGLCSPGAQQLCATQGGGSDPPAVDASRVGGETGKSTRPELTIFKDAAALLTLPCRFYPMVVIMIVSLT